MAGGQHMMCETGDYTGGMGATSVGSGHSRSLRLILRAAREEQDLSAKVVGERIARHLQDLGDPEAEPVSQSTIYAWEKFDRHPSISNFAAWARVHVLLDSGSSGRAPVLVGTDEAAEAARRIDRLQPADRAHILAVIRAMTPDDPG